MAATPDEIRDQVRDDVLSGVASFSDGTNNLSMIDPEKRLKAAAQIDRIDKPRSAGSLLGGITKLNGPAGGFQ